MTPSEVGEVRISAVRYLRSDADLPLLAARPRQGIHGRGTNSITDIPDVNLSRVA